MKKLFFPLLAVIAISCSTSEDDCESKKQAIRDQYNKQIQYVKDNPGVNGIDYTQIGLIQQERDSKIAKACN